MKKDKKYWKKEAKGWKEVARIESEEANNWAAKAIQLEEKLDVANEACSVFYDQVEDLEEQVLYFKYLNAETDKENNKPLNIVKTTATWSKNIPWNPSKKCNCNCNCKK